MRIAVGSLYLLNRDASGYRVQHRMHANFPQSPCGQSRPDSRRPHRFDLVSRELSNVRLLPATEEHLPSIAELAGVIWRAYYPGIITVDQIEYMLERMYSIDTLRAELRSQGIRYIRLLFEEKLAGFASLGPRDSRHAIKLHKLYLLPELHGRGWGSLLLRHVEEEARSRLAHQLVLSVNKQNSKAIAAYERNGFVIVEAVVTDIGGGFVMDDYVMAKDLPATKSGSKASGGGKDC
jgi:diamine N-acetyltransferase